MTTQCPPHETVYMGRCMDCCQKVSRKPRRRLVAYGILVRGYEPILWFDNTVYDPDYEFTIADILASTGRV